MNLHGFVAACKGLCALFPADKGKHPPALKHSAWAFAAKVLRCQWNLITF